MKLWRFLNSRLVSSLCAVALLIFSARVGLKPLWNFANSFDGEPARRANALGRLQLLTFAEVPTAEDHPQKFVGKIRNDSSDLVTGVTVAVGFYDDARTLKDFFTARADGIDLLKPGQEIEFAVVRPNDRGSTSVRPTKVTAPHVELKFVDVSLEHTKQ